MRVKQINESRKLIVDGFYSLLRKKNYTEISMSDIAHEAMVSRMTLYRHFDSKEDIFKYDISIAFKSIVDEFNKMSNKDLRSLIYIRNVMMHQNKKIKTILQNEYLQDILSEFLKNNNRVFIEELFELKEIDKYKVMFINGGISQITHNWIMNNMDKTPEEITNIIMDIVETIV